MGRKPTKPGAVPRLRARRQKSGVVHYYYDHGGKPRRETALGSDYGLAIKRWADIEYERNPPAHAAATFRQVADRYRAQVIPGKAPRTQKDNIHELSWLLRFFDDPPGPLEAIRPLHVRQYIDWRKAQVRANREVALLSHLWNWARERGYTDLPNPCEGVRRNTEKGRDVYVEDDTYARVYAVADQTLRDALDLAYLTGQRPADVYAMDERDVAPDGLRVRQGKTGAKLRMAITGELAALLDRIMARKRGLTLRSTRLIVDDDGLAIGKDALRYRFDRAREAAGVAKGEFQMRDLRAKAGTDKADGAGDIRQAQAQLGHASVTMTEHYVRNRKGAKTTPTR
ncbi:MAG: tyrosine-type recombinase/integrase [Pseudoxanthomonas sp.]|nr:tyrosine-type recombinase/integrase [Pseudoxanthomonas sp.]